MAIQAQRPRRANPDHQPSAALIVTGPDDIRTRFARHATADLLAALASLRPRSGDTVGYAIPMALRDWGAGPSSSMASSNGWRC
jgi:hypothetical protein